MQDRVLQSPKVHVHFNTTVEDAYGIKGHLGGLMVKDAETGAHSDNRAATGCFSRLARLA